MSITLGILFFLGLIATIIHGVGVGKQFSREADSKEKIYFETTSDTIHVNVFDNVIFPYDIEEDDREFFELIKEEGDLRYYGEPVRSVLQSRKQRFSNLQIASLPR